MFRPNHARALWITPALAAFVQANEGLAWERMFKKWCAEHPDQPAPGNHEQMRRHFRKGEQKYLQKPLAVKVPTTMIPCTTCKRPFPSEGIFNRMCDPCKEKA